MKTAPLFAVNPLLGLVATGALITYGIYALHQKNQRGSRSPAPSRSRYCSPFPIRSSTQENELKSSDQENELKSSAQKALNSIDSKHQLQGSRERAGRGEHVFNNGLLDFHRSVLQDVLRELEPNEQNLLENLLQDISASLSQYDCNAISSMVAHFSWDENYLDYNAEVFGVFVRELREAIVAYVVASTSVCHGENRALYRLTKRVQSIAEQMVEHKVYVDPLACKRWLNRNPKHTQVYYQVKDAVDRMFLNILKDFKKVSDKIKHFRRTNNWNWP